MSLPLQSRVPHVPKGPQTSDCSFNQHSLVPGFPAPENLSVETLVEGGGQPEGPCNANCPTTPALTSAVVVEHVSLGRDFLLYS